MPAKTALRSALAALVVVLLAGANAHAQGGPNPTPVALSSTGLQALADDRLSQLVTNRVLSSVLLGVNEQVNCGNCVSGFASAGSFSAGAHGRKALSENLALIGGVAYSEYGHGGYKVTSAPLIALALRYDFVEMGRSRPFFDLGATLSPWQRVRITRGYTTSAGAPSIVSETDSANYAVFGRAGWVFRASPRDEFAVAAELWRGWQRIDGYTEAAGGNPFAASFGDQRTETNLVKLGGQWTHLFGTKWELNLNGGFVSTFSSSNSVTAVVAGSGTTTASAGEQQWGEYGARVGYRWTRSLITDVFLNGTIGSKPVGDTVHGGVGVRYTF